MTTPNHHAENHRTERDPSGDCSGHAPKAEDLTTADSADITDCLVMAGTPVLKSQAEEAGLYRDYDGQHYWLCCATCGPLFDADPNPVRKHRLTTDTNLLRLLGRHPLRGTGKGDTSHESATSITIRLDTRSLPRRR